MEKSERGFWISGRTMAAVSRWMMVCLLILGVQFVGIAPRHPLVVYAEIDNPLPQPGYEEPAAPRPDGGDGAEGGQAGQSPTSPGATSGTGQPGAPTSGTTGTGIGATVNGAVSSTANNSVAGAIGAAVGVPGVTGPDGTPTGNAQTGVSVTGTAIGIGLGLAGFTMGISLAVAAVAVAVSFTIGLFSGPKGQPDPQTVDEPTVTAEVTEDESATVDSPPGDSGGGGK